MKIQQSTKMKLFKVIFGILLGSFLITKIILPPAANTLIYWMVTLFVVYIPCVLFFSLYNSFVSKAENKKYKWLASIEISNWLILCITVVVVLTDIIFYNTGYFELGCKYRTYIAILVVGPFPFYFYLRFISERLSKAHALTLTVVSTTLTFLFMYLPIFLSEDRTDYFFEAPVSIRLTDSWVGNIATLENKFNDTIVSLEIQKKKDLTKLRITKSIEKQLYEKVGNQQSHESNL